MGCAGSKNDSALGRLSSYQIAAAEAETAGFLMSPLPLAEEEAADAAKGNLLPIHFHNLFHSGLYAPFIRNPDYLLIIDARDTVEEFQNSHVIMAKWHGHLEFLKDKEANPDAFDRLAQYWNIVVYDNDGSGLFSDESHLGKIVKILQEKNKKILSLEGGLKAIATSCPHLIFKKPENPNDPVPPHYLGITWFPSIVIDGQLFLGRREQADDPVVISGLQVTHIVWVADCTAYLPPPISPMITYLRVPLSPVILQEYNEEAISDKEKKEKIEPKEQKYSDIMEYDVSDEKYSEQTHKDAKNKDGDKEKEQKSADPHLVEFASQLPIMAAYLQNAVRSGPFVKARILISGDQGVNRSAALAMAFLMKERACTLEDAYYYVKRCRSAIQVDKILLKSLSQLEITIFGRNVTNIGDLEY